MASFDEAVREVRAARASNAAYLDNLKGRLTSPHRIPLVPFVGAGLSIPMGFPSWTGFLTPLAADCGKSAEIADLVDACRYEEAAEAVESGLGAEAFHTLVTHEFGKVRSYTGELKGALLTLPDLASGPVITTNFDRLLERVFAEANVPFEHVAWGSQVDSMHRAFDEHKPCLLKIHGDGEERSGRVLTKSEYDRHYAPCDPAGLRAQLARVFQRPTLLFVGCSLGPDRTMDVLSEVLRQASGLRHYAILETPPSEDQLFAKQKRLGDRGILPIWYPTGRHELIEPLLRWIASLQPSARAAAPELALELPEQRKKDIRTELDLLIPYQRTTEFVGRHVDFESLQAWVQSDASESVRVVTGAGGSGKTRGAIELIEWLQETQPGSWNCGFLTQAEMERFSGLQNLSQWRRPKPVLAVIDYAAGAATILRTWLEQLSAAAKGAAKFRLLLLEREASTDAGWLSTAIGLGYAASALRSLFDPPQPVRLEPVAGAADRRNVLRAALVAGAAQRNTSPAGHTSTGRGCTVRPKDRAFPMGRSADPDDGGTDCARYRACGSSFDSSSGPRPPARWP